MTSEFSFKERNNSAKDDFNVEQNIKAQIKDFFTIKPQVFSVPQNRKPLQKKSSNYVQTPFFLSLTSFDSLPINQGAQIPASSRLRQNSDDFKTRETIQTHEQRKFSQFKHEDEYEELVTESSLSSSNKSIKMIDVIEVNELSE